MKRLNYLCLVGLLFASAASAARGESIEWVRQLGTSGNDESHGVSADGLGNVYISGVTTGSLGGPSAGNNDAFVSKYDAAGTFQWTRQLGTSAVENGHGVSADGLGNVYISGNTTGSLGEPIAGDNDAFVSKYDAAGTFQWTRQLGTSAGDFGNGGVSADGLGNVYISGITLGSLGGPYAGGTGDAFVSKYDAAGNFQWTQQLGTSSTDWSLGVSADGLGNVYISGQTLGSLGGPNAGSYDAFVSKYDAAGTLQWTRQLGTSAFDASRSVSADGLGSVYISGFTSGSLGGPNAGGSDAFVSKYDAAGTLQWTRQLGTSSLDWNYGVSADGLGNIYFSGYTQGSLGGPNAGSEDAFVVKIVDSVVPEPSTLLLLCFGSLAVLWRRRGFVCAAILVVVVSVSFTHYAQAVTIESVPVGNPGNAPDTQVMTDGTTGYGSVSYNYRIGKYEVTNSQYVEFLNGVDPAGANALSLYSSDMSSDANGGINFNGGAANGSKYEIKPGRDNNPVVEVTWYDSIRFANWLHNGQGAGNTEEGAYTLMGGTPTPSNGNSITRNAGAKWWLPSEDEWYKAAYHKNDGVTGNYWDFATSTDVFPYSDQPPGTGAPDPSNTGNFFDYDGSANGYNDGFAVTGTNSFNFETQNYLTDVGAYTLSDSPYGTFDQGGNVREWNEALIGSSRGRRGGSWGGCCNDLHASKRVSDNSPVPSGGGLFGFRVASIPEPSTLLLLCFGSLAVLWRRRRLVCAAILAVVVSISFTDYAQAVTIDTVPVGNPGNAPDTQVMSDGTTGYGSVANPYRIGMTEVTNAQYVEFLNGVAASDPYQLYNTGMGSNTRGGITRSGSSGSYGYSVKTDAVGQGPGGSDYSYGDKPVVLVSWYDSIRFANWLHNGQGSGDTENGAYTLSGGTPTPSNGNSITRNPGARWWLPSEDEWYKAAYFDPSGVYYDYPTATNSVPNNNLPSADTGNSANFYDNGDYTTGNESYPITDAGAYALSVSPYGTFDQGGNIDEWNETLIFGSSRRGVRGGSCFNFSFDLRASNRWDFVPSSQGVNIGFRVASIPEPSTLLLLCFGSLALLWRRRGLVCASILAVVVGFSCADHARGESIEWVRQLGTSANDFSYAVSADGLGNVYISGYTGGSLGGPSAGNNDAFVSKYDAAGTLQWSRQLGTSASEESFGVSADGLGNVYLSGRTNGSLGGPNAGLSDAFVSKYDAAGNFQWSRQLGTTGSDGSRGVSADGLGNVYISGFTGGSLGGPNAGSNDAFVSKYDAAGNFQWMQQLGTSALDLSNGVSADGLGNVYFSGQTAGSLGGPNAGLSDAFVSKYDAAGNFQWSRQLGTTGSDASFGVSADGLGNVYISGAGGSDDAFVSKYDAAGNFQWTQQLGTSATDFSFGVSADGLGNIYISGGTSGSLGGPNAGSNDAFVSKYDAAGNFQWTQQLGTSALDLSNGVSADGLGNVYFSGQTAGSLGRPNPTPGTYDAFVVKIVDSVVPEPNTLLLLCFGSLAVLWRRRGFVCAAVLAAVVSISFIDRAEAVTIDTVPVGNPGNAGEVQSQGTFGAVGYNYRIGKIEVTNAQYVEFLNGVDSTGTNTLALYNGSMSSDANGGINFNSGAADGSKYEIKSGRDNNPVVFVSWYDSIRFANWLHNGQGTGDTENGAYTLGALGAGGVPTGGNSITRNAGAKWWLPSENEWYKAAYHKNDGVTGNYWDYPTSTDAVPYSDQPPGAGALDPSNTANFYNDDGLANGYDDGYAVTGSTSFSSAQNYLTDVGAYTLSDSPYGTFDQGGNVWERNETLISGSSRVLRGGSSTFGIPSSLHASGRNGISFDPRSGHSYVGFRVASNIPEPSTLLLLCFGSLAVLWRRRFVCASILAVVVSISFTDYAQAATIETVPVGNPGNANDPATGNLYGGVGNGYNIGKYEVTVGQYTAFLNAVAPTDTYNLYNTGLATDLRIAGISRTNAPGSYTYSVIGSPNHPVAYVNWGDAARFANWLHNGQPTGAQNSSTTEDGAYTLNGATSIASLNAVSRNASAQWFIPSESEWYKAAYHQPAAQGGDTDNYWNYPMRTNSVPYSDQPPGATPDNTRVGNFYSDDSLANGYNDGYAVTGSTSLNTSQNYLTDVGAYSSSPSFYGTFDQGGNVYEWNEALISGPFRGLRGGSGLDIGNNSPALSRSLNNPTIEFNYVGFRVATVPEPSTLLLLCFGSLAVLPRRRLAARDLRP